MRVLSHINVNLHSASAKGGLVFIGMGKTNNDVPEDVEDHPAFDDLVDSGDLIILEPFPEVVSEKEAAEKKAAENTEEDTEEDKTEK